MLRFLFLSRSKTVEWNKRAKEGYPWRGLKYLTITIISLYTEILWSRRLESRVETSTLYVFSLWTRFGCFARPRTLGDYFGLLEWRGDFAHAPPHSLPTPAGTAALPPRTSLASRLVVYRRIVQTCGHIRILWAKFPLSDGKRLLPRCPLFPCVRDDFHQLGSLTVMGCSLRIIQLSLLDVAILSF